MKAEVLRVRLIMTIASNLMEARNLLTYTKWQISPTPDIMGNHARHPHPRNLEMTSQFVSHQTQARSEPQSCI